MYASLPSELHLSKPSSRARTTSAVWKFWNRVSTLRWFPSAWTEESERAKVILKHGWLPAFFRCWVHFFPISGVITVIALNSKAYMVGPDYLGDTSTLYQTLDVLGLQLAAKILELMIGASLGLVVMDILRNMLLNNGLPLGLIDAKLKLSSVSYFWSEEFIGSQRGLRGIAERGLLPLFLFACGIIMLLAGPSTALLVIPRMRDDWPVGSAQFWQIGNASRHFPDKVGAELISPQCILPSPSNLTVPGVEFQECPWAGYSSLFNAWEQRLILPKRFDIGPLDIFDNDADRKIVFEAKNRPYGAKHVYETSAMAVDVATAMWSEKLTLVVLTLQSLTGGHGPRSASARNLYAENKGSVARVQAPIPIVRVRCAYNDQTSWDRTTFSFPLLPLYATALDTEATFFNVTIPSLDGSGNMTYATANWVDVPSGKTAIFTDANDAGIKNPNPKMVGYTSEYPSALLNVRVPYLSEPGDPGFLLHQQMWSCSVDARWAPGLYVKIGPTTSRGTHSPQLNRTRVPDYDGQAQNFLPVNDGSWRTIAFDREWLETLTPLVDSEERPYQRTIAKIFQSNATADPLDTRSINWYNVTIWLEQMVATVVVDGMSRIGLQRNSWADQERYLNTTELNLAQFESGWTEVPPAREVESWDRMSFVWSLTATGMAYNMNTTATKLALALLCTYLAIALMHMVWTVRRQYASQSWNSTSETILLFHNSPPAAATYRLRNTCAGIASLRTMSRRARIRALPEGYTGPLREELCVFFDGEEERTITYEKVRARQKYGSVGGILRASAI